MLLIGLALFTVASLLCGLATSGALLSPAALATITTTFHGQERTRALGIWAAIGGTGAALGVLLRGVLTAGPGWNWVFFVNVPVGLLVFLALPRFVPGGAPRVRTSRAGRSRRAGGHGDYRAADLRAGDSGWGSFATLASLAGSVALYAAFVMIERVSKAPLMRADTMARRPVISGAFVILVATGLLLGLFFTGSLNLQHVLGFSAQETGLIFLPVAIAITLGAQLGSHLIGRIGGRPVAVGAFALVAVGAALMTGIAPDSNAYLALLPGFLIAAFGIGPAFVAATTTTMANVPAEEAGVASGVVNTFHELGGSIGVALVSTVAAASLAPGAVGVGGFTAALTACAVVAGLTTLIALALVPGGKPAAAFVGHGHGH